MHDESRPCVAYADAKATDTVFVQRASVVVGPPTGKQPLRARNVCPSAQHVKSPRPPCSAVRLLLWLWNGLRST
jgi:hypothetical protein